LSPIDRRASATDAPTVRLILVLVLAAVALGACELLSLPSASQAARPCEAVFSTARCEAMLTVAAEQLGVPDAAVTALEIAPDPTPRSDGVVEALGGARAIVVIAHVGPDVSEVSMCGGLPTGPACMDDPAIGIASRIGGGYTDVPCAGEAPDTCATPLPTLDPTAVAAAEPLRVERRVIPVPAIGRHEVVLGTATLPNGVLTVAQAELADPWPDGVRVSSLGIQLEVRSLAKGRPAFENAYLHGWWPGTEEVEVVLIFEARHVEPGATIEIRDLVVG
jgi:hypothetical protein